MTLSDTFAQLRKRNELALMPYVMAGYPTVERSLAILQQVAAAGADVIEIGVPFSDPVADGVTIESASHDALTAGFQLTDFLHQLATIKLSCPAVLMSYLNPLLAPGRDHVLEQVAGAHLSGLIVPDLPPDEASEFQAAARRRQLDMIYLVAPTTTDERIARIAAATEGFLYAVSLTGTTGVRRDIDANLPAYLRRLRNLTDKPIAVGFGISTPEHARAIYGLADGVVVGSRIVQAIRDGDDLPALIQTFKQATRG